MSPTPIRTFGAADEKELFETRAKLAADHPASAPAGPRMVAHPVTAGGRPTLVDPLPRHCRRGPRHRHVFLADADAFPIHRRDAVGDAFPRQCPFRIRRLLDQQPCHHTGNFVRAMLPWQLAARFTQRTDATFPRTGAIPCT